MGTTLTIDESETEVETPWRTYREAFEPGDFVYLEIEGVEFEVSSSSGATRSSVVVKLPAPVAARLGLRVD